MFDTIAKVGIRPPLHSLIVMGPEGWALAEWTGKPGVPFEINRIKSNGRVEGKPKLTVGGREPYESKGNARDPGIVRNVAKLASKLVDVWKSNWNAQNPGIARNVAELAYEHVTAWNDKPTANHKEGMERLEAAMLVEDQKEVSKGGPDYYTQWDIIARTVTDEMNHRVAQLGKPYPVEEAAAGTDLAGLETQHSPVDATALHPETVVEPANDLHPPPIAE